MATTGVNFVLVKAAVLDGAGVEANPNLIALGGKESAEVSRPVQVVGGSGTPTASLSVVADRLVVDPSLTSTPAQGSPYAVPDIYGTILGGYAKNGSVLLKLSGTVDQTVDLTDTTAGTPQAYAGDTAFSNVNLLVVNNLGTGSVEVAPTSAALPNLSGTAPTLTVAAGSIGVSHSKANLTVDGSHKVITVTPAATTTVVLTICGS